MARMHWLLVHLVLGHLIHVSGLGLFASGLQLTRNSAVHRRASSSPSRTRPLGERFNRLEIIKRADVGAKGFQQVIVPSGGTIDEGEVRLVMVTGPPVVRGE